MTGALDVPQQTRLHVALHILVLWSFAIAQPVYDVLRRNGEFFVAHRANPADLLLFVGLLSVGAPLLLAAGQALLARIAPRAGRVAWLLFMATLSAAVMSQAFAHSLEMPWWLHGAVVLALGAGAAWAYAAAPPVRLFMTVLSPSVLVFPALFLLHPAIAALVRPDDPTADAAAPAVGDAPAPVVFVVFDQLPVTSLMDTAGDIDRSRFPGFAALADDATWYRNASTMAELTGWALPPLLTGLKPRPDRVPTWRSYPHNLFTWLREQYEYEVFEPITQLCPEELCRQNVPPRPARLAGMLADTAVVYLHIVLPAGLRAGLPPLTENWKNFVRDRQWQRRWVSARDADRRRAPAAFIEGISGSDPQPTLYFLHALLPHEPYIYLRSGQQFTLDSPLVGLAHTGRWTRDEWPVVQAYRRHLLQLEYVDEIVRRLLDRLKAENLYDRALIVVTSDHGVSFRPGRPLKGLEGDTIEDIMTVPLFVKAPGQTQGAVDDSNVQSIDVVPTVAELLGIELTWLAEGRSARQSGPGLPTKTIYHSGVRRSITLTTADLQARRDAAVARKARLFGDAADWPPLMAPHRDLIGRPVGTLPIERKGALQAVVDEPARFSQIDADAAVLPGLVTGRVFDERGEPLQADIAVAVGGVVRATTRTYHPREAVPGGSWSALFDPRRLAPGPNDVQVFVVQGEGVRRTLTLGYASNTRPERLNLASRGASDYYRVKQSGFYPREGSPIAFRWTDGAGILEVPLETGAPPRSLRVGIVMTPHGPTPLTISVNECRLFHGPVDETPWYRVLSLDACPPSALAGRTARIVLKSPAVGSSNPGDPRTLGVAVETVNLFSEEWPLKALPQGEASARIRADGGEQHQREGSALVLQVSNTGETIWLPPALAPDQDRGVEIGLKWRGERRASPHEQRLQIPYPLYPGDRVMMALPLVPPAEVRDRGPWQVAITPIEHDGSPIPVEQACVVEVLPSPSR